MMEVDNLMLEFGFVAMHGPNSFVVGHPGVEDFYLRPPKLHDSDRASPDSGHSRLIGSFYPPNIEPTYLR